MRSGDGAIDTYMGGEKAGAVAKGEDADHRSVACEPAGRLHGPYADRLGPAQSGPMVFQNYRARPACARL